MQKDAKGEGAATGEDQAFTVRSAQADVEPQAHLPLTGTTEITTVEFFCYSPSHSLAFALFVNSWGGQQPFAFMPCQS